MNLPRLFLTTLLLMPCAPLYAANQAKPNIIVIFTDDHGWADLGVQGIEKDIRTPNIDALATGGVRATNGYITAPQCVPSRAGLLSGRYQNRFGVDGNGNDLTGFDAQRTIAERLKAAGYATGMAGKWHLGPPGKITTHGFDEVFCDQDERGAPGEDADPADAPAKRERAYHLDANSDAACGFIKRHAKQPFLFYLSYRAPHVPLDAPPKYLDRFPGEMPERRRQCLAMMSAVDDGVGAVMATLREAGLEENTLVFFMSDNGAPLKIHKRDAPGGGPGWDGSLNAPMNGEKGMLSEGGIRVPWVASWKGRIPAGQTYEFPVISLDVAATAVAVAGLPNDPLLDGVNLIPFFTGENKTAPHDTLFWRWGTQAAVREGHWKLLVGGPRRYLFDLNVDPGEKTNVLTKQPEIAERLNTKLEGWASELQPPGVKTKTESPAARAYFDFYLDGKSSANKPAAETKPNIVFILADDLGWADTTLYGHTTFYKTPNIERLAKRGVTFTRAYSASPLCSPTRAAILTGLSPARTGLTTPNCHGPQVVLEASVGKKGGPGDKAIQPTAVTRLKTEYRTLAETLKEAGYATGHFGKWHLGPEPYSPLQQGFDVDLPHHAGPGPAGSYVAPWKFKDFDADPGEPNQHLEDRMAKEAVAFLEKHQDEPFFLNYWMFSVHAPFDAKKALIEKYRGGVNPNDPQRSPTYAAMIESMDDAVGTLLDTLDRLKLTEQTIIVFTSDNGGNMYKEIDNTTPTSNAPLRGGKATMYEGGTRVPAIIVMPGVTQVDTRSDCLLQSEDYYPTLLDALALKPAPDQAFDGVSILPVLKGGEIPREAVFQYFPHHPPVPEWLPPSVSVHRGDWKLIRLFHGGEKGAHRYLLYNLREDIGEMNNLAASSPALVTGLDALIEKFLADTKAVVPVPNPAFDPAKYHPENEGKGRMREPAGPAAAPKPKAAEANDPALQGWKARNGKASVKEGIVTVTGQSDAPFLGVGAGTDGPAVLSFRVRCEGGGEGKVEWIAPGADPSTAHSVAFTIKGGEWQSITTDIPASGPIGILRLYLPAREQAVDVDWIELKGSAKPRRWEF